MGLRTAMASLFARTTPRAETRNAEVVFREDMLSALGLEEILRDRGPLNTRPIKTKQNQLESNVGWVYAAVQILSGDVAARPFALWKRKGIKRKDWEEVELHPILKRPNAQQTWAQLAEMTSIHLDLTGTAYWNLITNRPGGEPVGIQTLVPSWVTGYEFDAAGRLAAWELLIPGKSRRLLSAQDVIFLRWPHPSKMFDGASPIEAFALSYNMDLYARAYTGELLQNRAQPSGIISTEQEVNPEQADTIRERWLQRYGKGRTTEGPAVLGRGSKYQALSLSIADLAFLDLAQLSRDQVLAIYRVPASKLGLTEDANLANSREAANSYAENALMPRLCKQQDAINTFLLNRLYGEDAADLYMEYETPIRRDIEAVERRSREDLRAGAITLNEHRQTIGKDPDPNGDVYFLPLGIRIVDKIEPRDPFGMSFSSRPAEEEPELEGQQSTTVQVGRLLKQLSDAQWEISGLTFKAAQRDAEKKLQSSVIRLFAKEAKLFVAALKANKLSAHNRTPVGIRKTLIDDVLNETVGEWSAALEAANFDNLGIGFELLGKEISAEFLLSWEIYQEEAARWARARAGQKIVGIQKHTRETVGKVIEDGITAGDPIDKIATAVSDKVNEYKWYRSESIARTETSNALNEGKYRHAAESERRLEVSYLKTWNPVAGDDRTREAHRAQNIAPALTIPFRQDFIVGGEAMARPLDERGSAGNVIRCRCTLTLEVSEP